MAMGGLLPEALCSVRRPLFFSERLGALMVLSCQYLGLSALSWRPPSCEHNSQDLPSTGDNVFGEQVEVSLLSANERIVTPGFWTFNLPFRSLLPGRLRNLLWKLAFAATQNPTEQSTLHQHQPWNGPTLPVSEHQGLKGL